MALKADGKSPSGLMRDERPGWAPIKAAAPSPISYDAAPSLLHGEKKVALEAAATATRGLRHRDAKAVKAAALAAAAQQEAAGALGAAEFLAGDDAGDIEDTAPGGAASKLMSARSRAAQAAKRNFRKFKQGRIPAAPAPAEIAGASGYGMKGGKNRGSAGALRPPGSSGSSPQRAGGAPIARSKRVKKARTRAGVRRKSAATVGQRAYSASAAAASRPAGPASLGRRAAHATRQAFRLGGAAAGWLAAGFISLVVVVAVASVVLMGVSEENSRTAGSLEGNEAKAAVLLKAKGFDSLHIAAILGNWSVESGCNPQQVQHGFGYCSAGDGEDSPCRHQRNYPAELVDNASCGYGMAQWTWPSRSRALVNFAKAKGADSGDMATQVDFFMQGYGEAEEFAPYVDRFKAIGDLAEATTWFHNVYEASADSSMDRRIAAAERIFGALSSQGAGGEDYDSANETQKAIADMACSGAIPGDPNMCAKWVDDVYDAAVRGSVERFGCANEAARAGIQSTGRDVPVGAQVYSMHSYGPVYHGDHDACHIGIYVGGGKIASNEGGRITYKTFEQWDATYGWRGWGWPGGVRPW